MVAALVMHSPYIATVAHNHYRNDRCVVIMIPAQRADPPSHHACYVACNTASFRAVIIAAVYGDVTMSGQMTIA